MSGENSMANKAKGKAKLATKKPSKVAGKKSPNKPSQQADKASKANGQQYMVFGLVVSAHAKAAVGLTVLAYDNDVANQDLLGQAVTDTEGAYAISYTAAQFKRTQQERGGADIVVCVLNAQQQALFISKKKNNAPAKFELNIQLSLKLDQLNLAPELMPAAEGEPASLGDVLGTIKGDWLKAKLNKVGELIKITDHKADDFLGQAKAAGFNKPQALQLRQTFYLGDVTQKNIALMGVLQPMVADDKQGSIQPLAALTPNDWLNLAYEHGTPPQSIVSPAEYAEDLQLAVENLVPHAALKAKLDSDNFVLIPRSFVGVKAVMAKYKDFNIAKTNIDQFAEDNKSITPETTSALRKLQHLKRLNASWDEASILVNANIDDAEEITNYSKDQFKAELQDHLPEQRLEEIYNKASALKATSIGMMGYMYPTLYGVGSAVMTDRSLTAHRAQIESNPTLRRLFGALDNCAYDPCLSVLSPAAYLADLLKFIDASPSASIELESRRPDIFDLELSCDNTKIELPQIDLAIEILENAVALPYSIPLPAAPIGIHPTGNIKFPPTRYELPNKELVDGQNIGVLVHQALESTVKDKLGNLIAHKTWEAASLDHLNDNQVFAAGAYIGPKLGNSNWIVKDSYRTWSLQAKKETFSASLNDMYFELPKKKVESDLLSLANNSLPDTIKTYLKANVLNLVTYDLPATIDFGSVVQLPQKANSNSTEWEVEVVAIGKIKLILGTSMGAITLTSIDGNEVLQKQLQAAILRDIGVSLGSGKIPTALVRLLTQHTFPSTQLYVDGYSVNQLSFSNNTWEYKYTLTDVFKFIYQPALISVSSLTYQSTIANRDLFVRPQNTNLLAYKTLAQPDACFPWSLPYNQALNETRETLSAAGVTRLSLLESTTPLEAQYISLEIAKERLGLSPAELSLIITSETTGKLLKIWGLVGKSKQQIEDTFSDEVLDKSAFDDGGLLTLVSILLQQAGLSFAEFDSLLESEFINPNGTIAIENRSNCKPSEMFLNKKNEGELAPFLDRLHRFVRLWRATGWQVWELDLAIQASGIGDKVLSNNAIVQIANLGLLKAKLHLPIDVLVAMIGGFNDKRYSQLVKNEIREITPLYNRLFQNRQLVDPPKQELAFTTPLSTLDESLTELIAASLGLRKSELAFILDSSAIDLQRAILNDTQTSKNELLQQVFRNVMLAKALGLTLYDYESAWQLFPSNHFESPASLLEFLIELDFVKNSDFELGELAYLLLDSTSNPTAANIALTEDRAEEVLTALQQELKQLLIAESEDVTLQQRTELVVKHMVLFTLLEPSFVSGILTNYLYSVKMTPVSAMHYLTSDIYINLEDTTSAFDILEQLYKVALLNTKWKASLPELAWFNAKTEQTDVFDGLLFDSLQSIEMAQPDVVSKWKKSTALLQLVHASPEMTLVTNNYLSAYQSAADADKISTALDSLASSFSLSEATVEACVTKLGMADNEYLNPIHFDALIKLLSTVHQLGIDGAGLASLVSDTAFEASAELAGKLLKSRFSDSGWQKALRKINDALRIQQRDRLVDYLLAKVGLRDVNDLYKHYLIDFEMSPCMNTTRMLQSTAAVQLFVQRCLFNLEQPHVTPNQIDRKRWEWMQNYRVWEANRKVFLYPENWLFPEVRDDRTETFKAFESALMQNEPSHENATSALKSYLEGLVELSKISVIGIYEHIDQIVELNQVRYLKTLYLVGRTSNPPYSFYWRKANNFTEVGTSWTGWKKVDCDLSSDHIIPFVLGQEFYLAWPIFKTIERGTKTFYQVKIAWAKFNGTGWTKRQESRNLSKEIEKLSNRDERGLFAFRCRVLPNEIATIESYAAKPRSISEPDPINPNTPSTTILLGSIKDYPWTFTLNLYCLVKYTNGQIAKIPEVSIDIVGLQLVQTVIAGTGNVKNPYANYYDRPICQSAAQTSSINIGNRTQFFSRSMVPGTFKIKIRVTKFGKTVEVILNDVFAKSGDSVLTSINILFTGVDAPATFEADETFPLFMQKFATFELGKDDESNWKEDSLGELVPLENSYSYSSGFRERSFGGVGFFKPGFSDKMFVASTYPIDPMSAIETWYVEEGLKKAILKLEERAFLQKVYPAGYSEALLYKKWSSDSLDLLFSYSSQEKNSNKWFGVDDLNAWVGSRKIIKDPRDNNLLGFDLTYPNANYNWEVFYHLPTAAAIHLSRQHRFEEARKWFHFIFDPTTNDASTGRERFWRFLPFRSAQVPNTVSQLLEVLGGKPVNSSERAQLEDQIKAWLADPFNPFAVARLRNSAFEWYTVIAYIKNLTDWADQLFRRDTRESINEATLLYIMAAEILGPRPEKIRLKKDSKQPLSYRSLKSAKQDGLDDFSNVWFGMVGEAELEQASQQAHSNDENEAHYNQLLSLASIGSLYFNVPANEKLPELWDMVDDRLFKIRHCQNIEGVRRSLPLYEPPIDPELLIRAKAAGLDLADVLADRSAPLPHYRFQVLLQKANEFCGEVKNLGGAILSAVEKKESEHLALLRSSQEIDMLKLIESIKQEQIKEAEANIDALNKTKNNALNRFVFLQRQLGKNEITFDATGTPIVEQSLITQVQETGIPNGARSLSLINNEVEQLWKMQAAHDFALVSSILKTSSGIAHLAGGAPPPAGPIATALGHALSVAGDSFGMASSINSYLGNRSSIIGGWQRRRDEWVQQSKMTAEEIRQIDKQIIALEIRQSIATKELENHHKQIENAQNIDEYMRHMKFTGESLYGWMESQISGLYFSAYQMAYDLAKKAERAYQFELGEPLSNFVQYGHWDSLRKGLLSGERLSQNLRRMEVAHLERNRRELEITKHISLRQLDSLALMKLRETGECNFNIPEVLFDIDFPGHYFRRIKSVSISVPCVVGPYTSVNGTLTLESSKLRDKAMGDYDSDENSYKTSFLPTQSIATSSGQNDSGVFELNFRDERYLPFEGAGAISNWAFKLPKDFKPFDYDTIGDVILHVRYTARDGGEDFATKVNAEIINNLNALKAQGESDEGLWSLLDLRHDYPEEWSRYNKSTSDAEVKIKIGADRFPYILRGKVKIEQVSVTSTGVDIGANERNIDKETAKLKEKDFNQSWIALRYSITKVD